MQQHLRPASILPLDHEKATLLGRVWSSAAGGPKPVLLRGTELFDLSALARTLSQLLELKSPLAAIEAAPALPCIGGLAEILRNTDPRTRDTARPWLLAPCDLQALKASGVTFVESLLERVIEEQARGDASKADEVRRAVVDVIGSDLAGLRPGSPAAMKLKQVLIAKKLWSQYLEVGIGPDAEIFTKSQPMSAVGCGMEVGIHPQSRWNNPEPEIVLAANSRGEVLGATLGNDVNLRDFEGRSALLLGKAKDNNGSCAIGPFIRLFDAGYGIDDVRRCEVTLRVEGLEGYVLKGGSSMAKISRDPLALMAEAIGPTHRYPDGLMLFLGTMFAPTDDRGEPGQGFTHALGDIVSVATPHLGTLVNRVNHADKTEPWSFGIGAMIDYLSRRG
jgi:fumarylacetoacetate (FAA) hydrolase family protein